MKAEWVLTRKQVRRIDELAQRRYGLAGLVLMENAGRGAAQVIDREFGPGGSALIVCGTGNNGGDGLVIARHLHNAGWEVRVLIADDPESMSPDCAANDRVVRAMGLERAVNENEFEGFLGRAGKDTVVVDALLGTGFHGVVRPALADLIEHLNTMSKASTVAIDVPSGLDCDTGEPGGTAIRADLTITFVAMKPGFFTESGKQYAGRCEVVDIGVPVELIGEVARFTDAELDTDK